MTSSLGSAGFASSSSIKDSLGDLVECLDDQEDGETRMIKGDDVGDE
ncbi:MAG: hypothetical protein R3F11_32260 [Verrucomicrobiales bacterium]